MPNSSTVRSDSVESGATAYTERRYGCYGWGLIMSLLLLTFVMVICVILLVQSDNAVLLLSVLLTVIIVVALIAFGFLHWLRHRALRSRDQGASDWVHRTLSQDQEMIAAAPTAPSLSTRASWDHVTPWKTSTPRATSQTPSYHVVST